VDEEAGGNETDSSIDESSDWVNRIDCIPHINWVQMVVCEIPNIEMNFRSAGIWAHHSNLPRSNWKRSLRTTRRLTKVQKRFRSKWMVRKTSIQIIPVQYWILFSTQSKTNLTMSVLMRRSGCWMPNQFANHQMFMFQATSIQLQACLERSFWCTKFGSYGSLWGGGFGILICPEHWWQIKYVLARLQPQWQQQWYANCRLRKM